MGAKILVIDDDPAVLRILADMIQSLGHSVETARNGEKGLVQVKACDPDILLLDLNLPDIDGLEVLKRARALRGSMAVILFSGSLSVPDTVEAMRLGAFNCLTKPVSMKDLEHCINQAATGLILHKEIRCEGLPSCPMVVASPEMKKVSEIIRRVSQSPASTVLIMGETGTGKEVVARYLHHLSDRQDKNFVAVNCAAIPESLIESELFGHERGAFTDAKAIKIGLFEEAHEGTLFLDEIGELSPAMQAKLLRVLQERVVRRVGGNRDAKVDVRVIAATNINLKRAVSDGRFREDLYYRLLVIPLVVPPLRERREDILPLTEHFLRGFAKEFSRPVMVLSEEDKVELLSYPWPGNVRELKNCVERAVLLDLDSVQPLPQIVPSPSISRQVATALTPAAAIAAATAPVGMEPWNEEPAEEDSFVLALEDPSLANAERALIYEVMGRVHGNKNQAASMLGINRTTLYRKLTTYGMEECHEEVGALLET